MAKPTVSKTVTAGSNPAAPAKYKNAPLGAFYIFVERRKQKKRNYQEMCD